MPSTNDRVAALPEQARDVFWTMRLGSYLSKALDCVPLEVIARSLPNFEVDRVVDQHCPAILVVGLPHKTSNPDDCFSEDVFTSITEEGSV